MSQSMVIVNSALETTVRIVRWRAGGSSAYFARRAVDVEEQKHNCITFEGVQLHWPSIVSQKNRLVERKEAAYLEEDIIVKDGNGLERRERH